MRKLAVGLAIASVAMALLGGPARAQYPAVTLFLTPNPVVPGGTVTATLTGCVVGNTITLTVDGTAVRLGGSCVAATTPATRPRP